MNCYFQLVFLDPCSNLFNVRQRYELVPYYYSLAHRAHQFAEPVFPPLFYYYPTDAHVRSIGHEKLIGRDILVGVVAALGQTQRDVYLPADTWVNYFTNGECGRDDLSGFSDGPASHLLRCWVCFSFACRIHSESWPDDSESP